MATVWMTPPGKAQTASENNGRGKFGATGGYIGKAGQPDDPPAPKGPTPHMPDGKVDFSGVWLPGTYGFASTGQVVLQPWADALYKERRANLSKDDPESYCLPSGVPRISPYPYKIVQTPKLA